MQQPVIQFGTAIHGKSLSGGALNRVQKLLHVVNFLSIQISKVLMYVMDSSKPGYTALCNSDHMAASCSNHEPSPVGVPVLIRAVHGTISGLPLVQLAPSALA
ncbi:MAG: hypothetical protein ABR956_18940 [Terracidiphilus sp.]|jgi:hypothetical protein